MSVAPALAYTHQGRVAPFEPDATTMLYDDETRRFNYLGGLILGLLSGAAVAVLAKPIRPRTRPRHLRDTARRATRSTRRGADHLREEVVGPIIGTITGRGNGKSPARR
jgi:hypothetical protein